MGIYSAILSGLNVEIDIIRDKGHIKMICTMVDQIIMAVQSATTSGFYVLKAVSKQTVIKV